MTTHAQVQLRREALADGDLIHRRRIGRATSDHPGPVDHARELRVGRGGDRREKRRARNTDPERMQDRERRNTGHPSKRVKLPRRQWREAPDEELHIRRPTRRVKPCQRGIASPCPRRCRQHHRTDHADQQRQRHDPAPTPPDLMLRQHPDGAHLNRPAAASSCESATPFAPPSSQRSPPTYLTPDNHWCLATR